MYVQFKTNKCKIDILFSYNNINDELGTVGSYEFTIPLKYKEKLREFYGDSIYQGFNIDEEWDYEGDLTSENPDLLIYWMYYIIDTHKYFKLEIGSDSIFWVIHDLFHCLNDFCGKEMYCGAYQELSRYKQAYRWLKRRKIEIEEDYMEKIIEMFNERKWGCYGSWNSTRKPITLYNVKYDTINC